MRASLAPLILGLLLTACGGPARTTTIGSSSAPAAACDVSGRWTGAGRDRASTSWTYALTLDQVGDRVTGRFDWAGDDGTVGPEDVAGTIDCAARTLALEGHIAADQVSGSLAASRYRISLDPSFASFEGTWTGVDVVPGTFAGRRD